MFKAKAHAVREIVANGIECAAEGMGGGGGDATRGSVAAFDPKFARTRLGGVGGGAEPACALPGFTQAGRGVGGGDGGNDVEGDVGVRGKEGGPACGGIAFAAEGGVGFNLKCGGVRSVAGLVGNGAQGVHARGHDGCGEREAQKKEWSKPPLREAQAIREKCREEGGEREEGGSRSKGWEGKPKGFTGRKEDANQESDFLLFRH